MAPASGPRQRPEANEIAALLEPIVRRRIPGAADARIANWSSAERGLSTETFLFDLLVDGPEGVTTLQRLVFRRPPAVSLYSDYDLLLRDGTARRTAGARSSSTPWSGCATTSRMYGQEFEVTAVLDWEIAYIGDHEADLAWLLFVDWACSEYEGVPRLDGTPSREETVDRYEQLSGRAVRNLRYNEVLAAVEIGLPVSRLETRLRNEGLLTDDFDLTGFCVERIRQLLD